MAKNLIILGQTATGKTKLSIELAKQIGAEIISADSMQVYRGMDIGTAKPTIKERQGVPHHLIDIKDPDKEWTVADFVKQANHLITHRPYIIVGGTGLYLWSLLNGYSFLPAPVDKGIRARLEKLPTSTLYAQLSTIDALSAQKIHANDKKRIIRALEVYGLTGKPLSESRKQNAERRAQEYTLIGLKVERDALYQRINKRVDHMIAQGLIDEVKGLLAKGYEKTLPAFQALGYKEVISYLEGKDSRDQMIDELKKRSRHFARRQQTWFKRFENIKWFDPQLDLATFLDYINNYDTNPRSGN